MEIKISTQQILKVLYVISWIIFLGVCIDAGSILFTAVYASAINPGNADYFGLTDLYRVDPGHFFVQLLLMSIVAIMKAIIFFLIIKILGNQKLSMSRPFNLEMGRFIFNVSFLALGTGMFSYWGVKYAEWLASEGVKMPDAASLRIGGADVWVFMSVTFFVIAQIFKKGIEIQSENDLTI